MIKSENFREKVALLLAITAHKSWNIFCFHQIIEMYLAQKVSLLAVAYRLLTVFITVWTQIRPSENGWHIVVFLKVFFF